MLLEASWLLLQVPERCSVSTGGGKWVLLPPHVPGVLLSSAVPSSGYFCCSLCAA